MKSSFPQQRMLISKLSSIASLSKSEQSEFLRRLTATQRLHLERLYIPLPHQLEPPGDWFIWVMQWGAGSGKTHNGAQLVRQWCDSGEARTVNVAGPTWVDTMRTMVHGSEGAPGLMGVWPRHQTPSLRMSKDDPYLRTHNGAKVQLFAAQKADRFRGPAAERAWFDEIDSWKPEGMRPASAFMLAEQRIRVGDDPRIVVTSTPKPGGLIAQLRKRPDCIVTRAAMQDNAVNLAATYIAAMEAQYGGTRLGRQELLGEILQDVAGAIVTMEMIDEGRITLEEFAGLESTRSVVGVDPFGGGGDACGLSAVSRTDRSHAVVLADRTVKCGPDGWAQRALELADEVDADCIVWEANFGGDMVPTILSHAMERMGKHFRLKRVWASKAKHVRFEPVGAFYERGEVSHLGTFPQLEDEIVQFTPQGFEGTASPNRADAMVFAFAELFPEKKVSTLGELLDMQGAHA